MACVIDNESAPKFEQAGINTIIPRNINWEDRYLALVDGMGGLQLVLMRHNIFWMSAILRETPKIHLCIDQANGHMQTLLKIV